MFVEKHTLSVEYARAQREVERILRGPIPIESACRAVWDSALIEAQMARNAAAAACDAAGLAVT